MREKCAVAGIMTADEDNSAAGLLYESLYALQHRGTEASGMASKTAYGLETHRELGLVRDIYDKQVITRLAGNIAFGHNRYSTSGDKKRHRQPVVDEAIGLAMGHNGNLPDTTELEDHLASHNLLHSQINDSEMIGLSIAQFMRGDKDLPDAIEKAYPLLNGAFSCVGMQDGALVAFRDQYGIRPLALGKLGDGSWAVSSETCGLDIIGASYEREVRPGELAIITKAGLESRQLAEGADKLDIFEFVYFARHDSHLYGQSVNEIRRKFGEKLADEHNSLYSNSQNTLVVPVPDTSIPEAEGYAQKLGLTQKQAIIKNRYIGRTFMQPTNNVRQEQLRRKHNIIPEAIEGKDVIFIDDSIVRLNTMPGLVKLAKQVGARSVSVLIGSPPVRFPDFYGIDTPNQTELAAANMTIEQMRRTIGCQYLGFLSLDGMIKATGLPAEKFNLSCFTGEYPIDIGANKQDIYTPVSMELAE
ncbi:MAG: amidophosphoribosyltransferase [Candidatus Saccharimonadales bacterium]